MKFADLLTEIGRAGYEAALVARKSSENTLRNAIEPNMADPPDGQRSDDEYTEYRFKRVMIRMPGPTLDKDEGQLVSIPLWAMLTGGNLDLDEIKTIIETEIDLSSLGNSTDKNAPVPASELKLELRRGLTKKSSSVKIEMLFKMGEPPEIAEQLRDKMVVAFKEAVQEIPIVPISQEPPEKEAEQ